MRRNHSISLWRGFRDRKSDADAAAPAQSFQCPGCCWALKSAEELEQHVERCEAAKAKALPKDDDAAGWAALSERMKNAALSAQAKGQRDEYEANLRRSDACAEKARAASEKQKGVA